MDMLLVRQARTLRRRLSRKGGAQGRLQASVEGGEQALIEARSPA
jgi:hypothetical protein